ncbi:MAG: hypothetical protein NVSMB12_14770 [Acidimicrobiales bacterium]
MSDGPRRRRPWSPATHLARRFFGALSPAGPRPEDEAWVASMLGPASGPHRLWARMSGPDRRHAVGVARRVAQAAETPTDRDVIAAALLHDVGKIASGLGTLARVPATLVGAAGGRRKAAGWARAGGARGRVGRYLRHPEEGAELLRAAGAPPLAVRWALEHHRPREQWTVPSTLATILKNADDD